MSELIDVRTDGMAKTGAGTAVIGGRQVHIAGLLPGEHARVSIVYVGKRRAFAEVGEIIEPLPGRRDAPCEHQHVCSGCPLMIADESTQAQLKRDALATLGLDVSEVVQNDAGARLPLVGKTCRRRQRRRRASR